MQLLEQSSFRAVSEQFPGNFRAVSGQFQGSFRAVSGGNRLGRLPGLS